MRIESCEFNKLGEYVCTGTAYVNEIVQTTSQNITTNLTSDSSSLSIKVC